MKFSWLPVELLVVLSLFSFGYTSEETESGARLLVSKQVLNKYIVQDMDLIVKYNLYNIGNQAAVNVVLSDQSFHPEVFAYAGGQLNVRINRIPPAHNITHVVVLKPIKVGKFNFSAAEVTYKISDESTSEQVSISSEPGEGYIVAFRDYDKKFSPHILDWLAFAVMTLPSLAIPFVLWWSSKSKYETLSGKQKKKE